MILLWNVRLQKRHSCGLSVVVSEARLVVHTFQIWQGSTLPRKILPAERACVKHAANNL